MVYRARTLELISEETYERHFRNMSARGWRKAKSEPLDETIPLVNRSLGKSSLELLENNNVINIWEFLSDLPLPKTVFQSVFERDLKSVVSRGANQVVLAKEFIRPTKDPHNRN
jgi:hypothetical protein